MKEAETQGSMDLIFYAGTKDRNSERLEGIVEEAVFMGNRSICRTIKSLKKELLRPRTDPIVSVLYAAGMGDLTDLLSIGEWLGDAGNILILPDGKEETLARAHLLRPRFLTYADGDFEDVALVLEKMAVCQGGVKLPPSGGKVKASQASGAGQRQKTDCSY